MQAQKRTRSTRARPKKGPKYWEKRIKDLLVDVVLYQEGKYSEDQLGQELIEFFKEALPVICEALRRNGAVCYPELVEEYGDESEAGRELANSIRNWRMLGETGRIMAALLKLSRDLYDDIQEYGDEEYFFDDELSDLIMDFDALVHAEHAAGAFDDFSAEEKSIFGVNIPKIKAQADEEIEQYLRIW